MKTILLFLTICLNTLLSVAQGKFEKTFNRKAVEDGSSSGTTIGGQTFINHDRSLGLVQTSDGGFVSVGSTSADTNNTNMLVVKMNAYGNVLWIKELGGSANDIGKSIQQTSDGGFIVAGTTQSSGSGGKDVQLTKLDQSGSELWTKVLGEAGDEDVESIIETTDSSFVLVGRTTSFGLGMEDVFVTKADRMGSVLWTKIFGGPDIDYASDVIETMDGGYVISGGTKSLGSGDMDAYIIKVDATGYRLWEKTIGDTSFNSAQSVMQTADGELVVVGTNVSAGNSDVYVIKLSANGVGLWTKSYGNAGLEKGAAIDLDINGNYVVTGVTNSLSSLDLLVFEVDQNGGLLYSKVFGSGENEFVTSISGTTDGGVVVGGYVVNSIGSESIYVVKTDSLITTSCGGSDIAIAENVVASSGWMVMGAFWNPTTFIVLDGSNVVPGNANFGMSVGCSNEPSDPAPGVHVVYASFSDPQIIDDNSSYSTKTVLSAEKDSLKSFNVFPNPSDGSAINVSMIAGKEESVLVVVYDMLGKEKYSKIVVTEDKGLNVFAIDPSGTLTSGMYMITATSAGSTLSKRLVIK